MKNFFLGALTALFFAHCSSQQNSENILTRTRMVSILTDIHILESKVDRLKIRNEDSTRKVFNTYQLKILTKHGTTKEAYEKSFSYYAEHPKELEEIYAIVVDSLNLREQKINMIVEREEELRELMEYAKQDSIMRIDSMTILADTLGIPFDSIVFLGDSLGFTLDSLNLTDSLTIKVDSLLVVDTLSLDSFHMDTTVFKDINESDSEIVENGTKK